MFDLTDPVTIVKPDSGGRFQSMLVFNKDHSVLQVEHGSGEFTLTKERAGTRYAGVSFRTFVDANDPADMEKANRLQDSIQVRQASAGSFEVPGVGSGIPEEDPGRDQQPAHYSRVELRRPDVSTS